jgi:hypothetical protein
MLGYFLRSDVEMTLYTGRHFTSVAIKLGYVK